MDELEIYAKEEEERIKSETFDLAQEITYKNSMFMMNIEEAGKTFDIDWDQHNVGARYNNKLIEIAREFEEKGLSMFRNRDNPFPTINYVGEAIMEDLFSRVVEGTNEMEKADGILKEIMTSSSKNPIEKLIDHIKDKITRTTKTERKTQEINSHLFKYREIAKGIHEYNLDEDVVPSIVKKVLSDRPKNEKDNIRAAREKIDLRNNVDPILKKLGLEYLLPKLRAKLETEIERQGKDSGTKSWVLSQEELDSIRLKQLEIGNDYKIGVYSDPEQENKLSFWIGREEK